MRYAAPEFGAVPLIAVRATLAFLCLLPFLFKPSYRQALIQHAKPIFWLSIISTSIPFCLFSYTTLYASAGYTSILNATTSIFSSLVAYFWLKEQLSGIKVLGIALGFFGVFILFSDNTSMSDEAGLLPILAALTATLGYAISGCYSKKNLSSVDPISIVIGCQFFTALSLLPFALVYWPETNPSTSAWTCTLLLSILCTALACIIYFHLLKQVTVSQISTVAYLIPFFGILWGYLFLDESITYPMLIGGSVIFLGVGLSTGVMKALRPKLSKPVS